MASGQRSPGQRSHSQRSDNQVHRTCEFGTSRAYLHRTGSSREVNLGNLGNLAPTCMAPGAPGKFVSFRFVSCTASGAPGKWMSRMSSCSLRKRRKLHSTDASAGSYPISLNQILVHTCGTSGGSGAQRKRARDRSSFSSIQTLVHTCGTAVAPCGRVRELWSLQTKADIRPRLTGNRPARGETAGAPWLFG